jgi:hypothetical protein
VIREYQERRSSIRIALQTDVLMFPVNNESKAGKGPEHLTSWQIAREAWSHLQVPNAANG